jgi:hypothetical protein
VLLFLETGKIRRKVIESQWKELPLLISHDLNSSAGGASVHFLMLSPLSKGK